jgi:geranylgeranyl pyrophosphate synthase
MKSDAGYDGLVKEELKNKLLKILPEKAHPLYNVAKTHFAEFGKMLRGTASLAVSNALCLKSETGLNWALAIELMHNASLVHDDVCDQDEFRRHHPTVFAKHGAPLAICFGDWLVAKSFECATLAAKECKGDGLNAIALISKVMSELSSGQAKEFTGEPILDWKSYDTLVSGKTVPLLSAAVEGPILLSNKKQYFDDIRNFVHFLGLGYQISNDISDALGKDGSEKPFSDFYRGAPNAVSITFRDTLKNGHRLKFEEWLKDEYRLHHNEWLAEIKQNGAVNICTSQLQQYIVACNQYRSKLPPKLQQALSPLVSYLEQTADQQFRSARSRSESS